MTATTAFYNVFWGLFCSVHINALHYSCSHYRQRRMRRWNSVWDFGGEFSKYRQKAPILKKHRNYTVCYSLRARSLTTVDFSPIAIDFFHIAAKKKAGYLEVNKLPLLFQNLPPSTEHTHSTANLSHLSTQQASSSAYCVSPKDTLPKIHFYLVTF